MSDYEKTLIGDSIQLMEVDDEESEDIIRTAEINADTGLILDNIGKDEFKEIYMNLSNEIKSLELEKKRELCEKILDKIYEVYDFEFTPKIEFNDEKTIEDFLKFIKEIEYDYIEFISSIIIGLDLTLLRKNTDLFIQQNIDKIFINIETLNEKGIISGILSNFLRTNSKSGLIEFFTSRFNRDKMMIILNIMEKEIENVGSNVSD